MDEQLVLGKGQFGTVFLGRDMNKENYTIDYIENLVDLGENEDEKYCALKVADREGLSLTNEAIIVDECLN